jgi:peptide/nickel transport system substrate-binding protein
VTSREVRLEGADRREVARRRRNTARRSIAAVCVAAAASFSAPGARAETAARHGIAMHGAPAKPAGFSHYPYADPSAPKGGRVALGVLGSFDSLNPFIVRGVAAAGLRDFVYESLLSRALDEPFTLYGLLARSVEVPDDRKSITFELDPRARFSDGRPVTVDDVLFSHALLRDKGLPNLRVYYRKVTAARAVGERTVRFDLGDGSDRELPLILGLMPILPRHAVDPETFEQTTLVPPVGSGPYVVAAVDVGRALTYRRNPDYWGRELPVTRGRFNFDTVTFEYARDGTTLFEAFKVGTIHVRNESDPVAWAESYGFPAARDGRVVRAEFETALPAGMTAFALNTRRPPLDDRRVRRALLALFDFEWTNKSLYNNAYTRTQSFFARSPLASLGRPADAEERRLSAALPPRARPLDPTLLDGTWRLPVSDGGGHNRANSRRALALLAEAGYGLDKGRMVRRSDGRPLALELLAVSRGQERLMLSYAQSLARLGIEAKVRQVDSSQFQARRTRFDFDIVQWTWPASLSPGNEQLHRWSAAAARTEGSFNLPGVEDPAVDGVIAALLGARERPAFEAAVRLLDRLLLAGDYVVPLFHAERQWLAHWSHLRYPKTTSLYGYQLDTWWSTDPSR